MERIFRYFYIENKSDKIIFTIACILLTLYLLFIFYGQLILINIKPEHSILISLFITIPMLYFGLYYSRKISVKIVNRENLTTKRKVSVFILFFVLTLTYIEMWQLAYWPGFFSPDSVDQYKQVLSGKYDDWHPVIHTLLIFGIPHYIFGEAYMIIFCQIVVFSLAISYLFLTLYEFKISKLCIICSYLYIILNPNTCKIMLYPWKDSAFSILATILFTFIFRIYLTKGRWFDTKFNIFIFTITCVLLTLFRHNGILLTLPIFIILLISKIVSFKKISSSILLFLSCIFIIKSLLYPAIDVEKPGRRNIEVLGLPLTILSNLYFEDKLNFNNEAKQMMSQITSQDKWKKYRPGNFNSIKFSANKDGMENVEAIGKNKIISYTIDAIKHRPCDSFLAFAQLTSMVWTINGNGYRINPGMTGSAKKLNIEHVTKSRTLKNYFENYAKSTTDISFIKYFFNFTGVLILITLFITVSYIGYNSLGLSLIILSPLCYNFGTMLLLSGSDFRFFHFNFLVIIPTLILLLYPKQQK